MTHVQSMLRTHPRPTLTSDDVVGRAIEAAMECAQSCFSCADACLGEDDVKMLVRCIRLNLDCAEMCETFARSACRLTEPDVAYLSAQAELCALICRSCGDECEKHAKKMEHCRLCAEACRACEAECQRFAQALNA